MNSSKMVSSFPEALMNFNRLILKLNQFICNWQLILPGHWYKVNFFSEYMIPPYTNSSCS